ncbi:unnamed protein product [Protopolystoma xenopodis]|uniref:Uncharacterized protein n=1 Tax=Protopolystoma xenopodis TaxID=117903 RepID=A0A448X5B9_9PLAT|nr:unnamed protein product [Protopolystoma xenopodis]
MLIVSSELIFNKEALCNDQASFTRWYSGARATIFHGFYPKSGNSLSSKCTTVGHDNSTRPDLIICMGLELKRLGLYDWTGVAK